MIIFRYLSSNPKYICVYYSTEYTNKKCYCTRICEYANFLDVHIIISKLTFSLNFNPEIYTNTRGAKRIHLYRNKCQQTRQFNANASILPVSVDPCIQCTNPLAVSDHSSSLIKGTECMRKPVQGRASHKLSENRLMGHHCLWLICVEALHHFFHHQSNKSQK